MGISSLHPSNQLPSCLLALIFGLGAAAGVEATAGVGATAGVEAGGQGYLLRVNCGGDTLFTTDGLGFSPDRAYSEGFGYGYQQGQQVDTWHIIGGAPDPRLHETARHNFFNYSFDVPDGDYLVTLHVADTHSHFPGTTSMDVRLEDDLVIDELDIYEVVERDYAMRFRFLTTVSDGRLEIDVAGHSRSQFSAIEVESAVSHSTAPTTPVVKQTVGSYGCVMIDWEDGPETDLAGYVLYRTPLPGGLIQEIPQAQGLLSRYLDFDAEPGQVYSYEVKAVDVFGNESPRLTGLEAVALEPTDTEITYVHLEADSADLAVINVNPYADIYIPASVTINDTLYANVEFRYRGNVTRTQLKKSYKIRFPENDLFRGKARKINLNSEFSDRLMLRERQSYTLFRELGVPTPTIEPANLRLNDFNVGVVHMIEQVDEYFLENHFLEENTVIYKAFDNLILLPDSAAYMEEYTKETFDNDPSWGDIIELIEMLNQTPAEQLYEELTQSFDVRNFLDYYSAVIAGGGFDFIYKNFFLARNMMTDIWQIYPWDKDLTFGPQSLWGLDHNYSTPLNRGFDNRLVRGMTRQPAILNHHVCNLEQLSSAGFSNAAMSAKITAAYDLIEAAGERDWRKRGWEDNTWFYDGVNELTDWVEHRNEYILDNLWRYYETPLLSVNELMAANDTFMPDDFGEYEDWIEIYNSSGAALSLDGFYLTDDLRDPYKWALPDTVLASTEFLVVWADDDSWQGPLHANFKLDRNGEQVAIHRMGDHVESIDLVFFGPQGGDLAWGRVYDGGCPFDYLPDATPGDFNYPSADVAEIPAPPQMTIEIHPNPVPAACTISLTLPQETRLDAGIFDVRGRRVRRLYRGPAESGVRSFVWDGRDEHGNELPSGIYWARADGSGVILSKRFVRLN